MNHVLALLAFPVFTHAHARQYGQLTVYIHLFCATSTLLTSRDLSALFLQLPTVAFGPLLNSTLLPTSDFATGYTSQRSKSHASCAPVKRTVARGSSGLSTLAPVATFARPSLPPASTFCVSVKTLLLIQASRTLDFLPVPLDQPRTHILSASLTSGIAACLELPTGPVSTSRANLSSCVSTKSAAQPIPSTPGLASLGARKPSARARPLISELTLVY